GGGHDPGGRDRGAHRVVPARALRSGGAVPLGAGARAVERDAVGARGRGRARARDPLPLDPAARGHDPDEVAVLSRMYERAILETDYPALSREQDRLIGARRGRSLRITDARGTNLRLRVPPDAWFHKNDGDVSPARGAAARRARDREMEFPSGALRFIPDVSSSEGKLVIQLGGAPLASTPLLNDAEELRPEGLHAPAPQGFDLAQRVHVARRGLGQPLEQPLGQHDGDVHREPR